MYRRCNDDERNDLPLLLTIAVLGGTGKEGSGLAMRWALNGYRVIIGSRDANRAHGARRRDEYPAWASII